MLKIGDIVAGRYRVLAQPLQGGQGQVYRAEDTLLKRVVALKLLFCDEEEQRGRLMRERRALQLLRLPGVVELLDQGEHEGAQYLILAWAEGAPFPGEGGTWTWEALRPRLLGLLAVLARVHAAGVVHRDLKPDNVLVDQAGRVTLLDFGLARGKRLGSGLTATGEVLGTLDFLAPELLLYGEDPSAASDLFAIGVMVWRALCPGRHPWEAASLGARVQAFHRGDPPFWAALGEHPQELRRWLERALERDPKVRFAAAGQALAALGQEDQGLRLTWLGDPETLETARTMLASGQSVDIAAPPGAGRTRLLKEITRGLGTLDLHAHWLVPAEQPFRSLLPLLGSDSLAACTTPDEAAQAMESGLRDLCGRDGVLVLDHPERIDPASATLIDQLRRDLRVLRIVPPDRHAPLRVGPVRQGLLERLFVGPERLLHRPSRAAALLHARSGGLPRRFVAELSAWESLGFASFTPQGFLLEDEAVDRLELSTDRPAALDLSTPLLRPLSGTLMDLLAWVALADGAANVEMLCRAQGVPSWEISLNLRSLSEEGLVSIDHQGLLHDRSGGAALGSWSAERRAQACQTLCGLLPPGTPGRLLLLIRADLLAEAVEETLTLGLLMQRAGRLPHALAMLESGLALARESDVPLLEPPLLRALALTALSTEESQTLTRARYELGRSTQPWPALAELVEASLLALGAESAPQALHLLERMAEFEDEDMEAWRRSLKAQAAKRVNDEAHAQAVMELWGWAQGRGPMALSRGLSVLGHLRAQQGALEEAITLHRRALAQRPTVDGQVATRLALCSALLDAGHFDEAQQIGAQALQQATEIRHRIYEARAEWLLRRVAYQHAQTVTVDKDLLEAAPLLRLPYMEGLITLTEAALAWRASDTKALALAARAAELLSSLPTPRLLALALQVACTRDLNLASAALAEVRDNTPPGVLLQVMALLAPTCGSPGWWSRAVQLAAGLPRPAMRREILSVEECLRTLRSLLSQESIWADGGVAGELPSPSE